MASKVAEQRANLQLADLSSLDRLVESALRRIASRLRVSISQKIRQGGDPSAPLDRMKDELINLALGAMVASHLKGRYRGILITNKVVEAAATPYDGAIKFLEKRLKLTTAELNHLRKTYSDEAVKVVQGATRFQERKILESIIEVTKEGLHKQAAVAKIKKTMESVGLGDKPFVYETVFRTQTSLAYAAGEANAMEDPAVEEEIWGWEYVTAGDDRVRPEHEALDGHVAAKDDPFWNENAPPNGFNCRCQRIPIFNDDPKSMRKPSGPPRTVIVNGETIEPGPDPGWAFNPGKLYKDIVEVDR